MGAATTNATEEARQLSHSLMTNTPYTLHLLTTYNAGAASLCFRLGNIGISVEGYC